MSSLDDVFSKGVESIITHLKNCTEESDITQCFQRIADECRDVEGAREKLVNKDLLVFISSKLKSPSESLALQTCRCLVNMTYYNEDARKCLFTEADALKELTNIVKSYPTLQLVGLSCYANMFESCEELQTLLIDDGFLSVCEACVSTNYATVIRTLNNISVLDKTNFIFASHFFEVFLDSVPTDLADTSFSEVAEFTISHLSYPEFRKCFVKHFGKFEVCYEKAIDVVVSPLFPKNVEEESLNTVCLAVKTVFDLYDSIFQYQDLTFMYENILDLTIAYTLHGDLFAKDFIPAPTQDHTCSILCHVATIDQYLPKIFEHYATFLKLTVGTNGNSKLMELQKHASGILQSFSTNEEYCKKMVADDVITQFKVLFDGMGMNNQPLIFRCLSVLHNMTVMLDDKSVLMTDSSCYLIVQTFKMMGNIVVRFSAVQCLRNLINADAKFFEVFKKNGGCDALLDVCLGKDERQENQEQPDKRVRYESTRILVSILKTDKDRLNDFARTDEVYKCLLENLKTDFALLIKEVMTLIIQFMDWGFSIPNEVLVEIRAVVKDKLETLLKSPAENQTMNKDVLDVFEKFLNH